MSSACCWTSAARRSRGRRQRPDARGRTQNRRGARSAGCSRRSSRIGQSSRSRRLPPAGPTTRCTGSATSCPSGCRAGAAREPAGWTRSSRGSPRWRPSCRSRSPRRWPVVWQARGIRTSGRSTTGSTARTPRASACDLPRAAVDLAELLAALERIDPAGGPPSGGPRRPAPAPRRGHPRRHQGARRRDRRRRGDGGVGGRARRSRTGKARPSGFTAISTRGTCSSGTVGSPASSTGARPASATRPVT